MKQISSSTSLTSKRKPFTGGGQHVAGLATTTLTRCASTGSTARPLSRTLPLCISALDSSLDVHTASWGNREAGMANLLVSKSGTLKFGSLPKVGVPAGLSSTSELLIAAIPSSPSGSNNHNHNNNNHNNHSGSNSNNNNHSSTVNSSSNHHNNDSNSHNDSCSLSANNEEHSNTLLTALTNKGSPTGGQSGAPANGTTSPTTALVDSLAHTLDRPMLSTSSLVLKADRLARLSSPQHTKSKFRGLTSVASSPTFEVQGRSIVGLAGTWHAPAGSPPRTPSGARLASKGSSSRVDLVEASKA